MAKNPGSWLSVLVYRYSRTMPSPIRDIVALPDNVHVCIVMQRGWELVNVWTNEIVASDMSALCGFRAMITVGPVEEVTRFFSLLRSALPSSFFPFYGLVDLILCYAVFVRR